VLGLQISTENQEDGGFEIIPGSLFVSSVYIKQTLSQGLKHAGRMWPARVFSAARDALLEFSNY